MDDVQATARWANRVLRPLTSIYRRLEKHQETLSIIATESSNSDTTKIVNTHEPNTYETTKARDDYCGSDADEDDPVWIPGQKPDKRRTRHKYSARGLGNAGRRRSRLSMHSPEASRTLPGAIELATPVITGKRWDIPSSARSQLSAEQTKSTKIQGQLQAFRDRYPLHRSPWQELLDQSGDSGFANIAHNLDRVLQNFLCNTRITKQPNIESNKSYLGARSLMSMVVRRLPEFIASEQDVQNEQDADGDEDMCDAYLTELESFYAPHGKGWKPLREAVRAQGIYLVSMMITNKWLTDPIACMLIEKCRYHEPDACEALLSKFLSTCTTYPHPTALKPSVDIIKPGDPVRLLRKYAHNGPAHRSYIFDELTQLLLRGVLPPEWMATKSWTSWMTRATISFSKGDDDCATASRLIESVLISASDLRPTATVTKPKMLSIKNHIPRGRKTRASSVSMGHTPDPFRPCPVPVEDALSNHVTSLLAALCGMHISRSRQPGVAETMDGTKAGHIINYLSFTLGRDMESKPLSHVTSLTPHQLLRRGCVLLASWLVQCNDTGLKGDTNFLIASSACLERYCEALASRSDLIKELASFMRQSFRCFGSATDNERLHMGREVRQMVSRLPYITNAVGLSSLLRRVAVEAAMEFAEGTGEPDDHLWAVEIQEAVISLQGQKDVSSESADDTEDQGPRRGYRWEESIGEWVARTPAVKIHPVPMVRPRQRVLATSRPNSCIPCSTDSSPLLSDRSTEAASSLTSSPPSIGTKRTFDVIDSSPLQPAKRRRPAPVVIVENPDKDLHSKSGSWAAPAPISPSREPVSSHRRVLRQMLNYNSIQPSAPPRTKRPAKVEVVVINRKEKNMSEDSGPSIPGSGARSAPRVEKELVEKQIHRTVPRRSGRPRTSYVPAATTRVSPRRSSIVVPCSEEDSEDELSFL
ncbi:hypothetical protein N7462_002220 [Penicillium macrosclerotiorum]|uniref:uncharacterized protein n=1 Tax=Penicillium macrosclerotiorum TaxID=303699 RepID=UPI002547B24C|nr:uncharacterized protein N7462_002220 [Penicillium macrosclerotiorum]KAJ5692797.1 hypothetical protein N7462_002220 [Penicillium macrosclerotiorum]